jgi:hypothetical protein
MTRWDLLKDLMLSKERRDAIGKAWPLFFFIVFHANKTNKFITSYENMNHMLDESLSTIKKWRDQLVKEKVINVTPGKLSMKIDLLSPYDVLVTCEQDDTTQLHMSPDPATKRVLAKVEAYGNMSLLPIVAELATKLDKIEKKLE